MRRQENEHTARLTLALLGVLLAHFGRLLGDPCMSTVLAILASLHADMQGTLSLTNSRCVYCSSEYDHYRESSADSGTVPEQLELR